jgi:hypothetical protein
VRDRLENMSSDGAQRDNCGGGDFGQHQITRKRPQ